MKFEVEQYFPSRKSYRDYVVANWLFTFVFFCVFNLIFGERSYIRLSIETVLFATILSYLLLIRMRKIFQIVIEADRVIIPGRQANRKYTPLQYIPIKDCIKIIPRQLSKHDKFVLSFPMNLGRSRYSLLHDTDKITPLILLNKQDVIEFAKLLNIAFNDL